LILRSKSSTECSADKWRQDPDVVLRTAEEAAEITLDVLHTLRLVVDGQLPFAFPDRGRRERFHGVRVLGRKPALELDLHGRFAQSLFCVAARRWRRRQRLSGHRDVRAPKRGIQVCRMHDRVVFDSDERRGIAHEFKGLTDNQRDGLMAEEHLVTLERNERHARRFDLVDNFTFDLEARGVLVRQDLHHSGKLERRGRIEACDFSAGDRAGHDEPVRQIRNPVFEGVLRGPRDLGASVDAGDRLADVRRHDVLPIRAAC
jgi:hypothetical protein